MELGTVSEWVSGLATAVAVVVALVFSLRQDREQRERKLASVYAWVELDRDLSGDLPPATLWLINNTDFPIYEWESTVAWPSSGEAGVEKAVTGASDWGLLRPGKHDFSLANTRERPLPSNDAHIDVELKFRDASGVLRTRLSTGRLV